VTNTSDKPRLLLVDFENVQQVELNELDDSYRVIIFVGSNQKSVPIEMVTRAQRLGGRIEWQRVSGEGRNALDFFIAWHLGRVTEKSPRPECIVLSKDKGFDPLLRHLVAAGMKCRRINSLQELRSAAPSARDVRSPKHEIRGGGGRGGSGLPGAGDLQREEPNVKRVVELLGKLEKRSRPRKRKTLAQSISAAFQKRLSRQEVDHIIDTLVAKALVSESGGQLHYHF
jgi:hypothetical protein